MAYLTLFAWSFLAATIIPLGSEPALVVLVRREYPFWPLVLVATAGNYLGACTTYWLAMAAARLFATRAAERSEGRSGRFAQRAARLIATRGAPALLLSWVPVLGDALVAAAGAAGMRFMPFTLWTVVGKFLRYAVVAWAAGVL